jgi:hypothetical protein
VPLLISQRSSGWAVVFNFCLFFSGDGGALQNCVEGKKEEKGGGGGEGPTKENPKTKALGFRSQHAIGLSPEWKSRRTTGVAKERSGNLRERKRERAQRYKTR